jgi:hypothetical protein
MTGADGVITAYLGAVRAALLARGAPGSELCDELYDHLAEVARDAEDRHEDPADACAAAIARFGTPAELSRRLLAARPSPGPRWAFALAMISGMVLAWVDSRPTWDDTGVTAGAALLVSAALGYVAPRHGWRTALAVGSWIPLYAIASAGHYAALLALAFTGAGTYMGIAARRLIRSWVHHSGGPT